MDIIHGEDKCKAARSRATRLQRGPEESGQAQNKLTVTIYTQTTQPSGVQLERERN